MTKESEIEKTSKQIIIRFTQSGSVKADGGKKFLPIVWQLVLDFFETEIFRSKYLFELNTEELWYELRNDFQWYLASNCVKDVKVQDVLVDRVTDNLIIIVEGCESIYTFEEMLKLIKEKIQHSPTWGGTGYRHWDEVENQVGAGECFDYKELLWDLTKLEKLFKKR